MPEKTLVMIFLNQGGNTVRMSVSNVKDGVTEAEVKTAMETIIAKNIFESNGGDISSIQGAEVVTRTVQELAVK